MQQLQNCRNIEHKKPNMQDINIRKYKNTKNKKNKQYTTDNQNITQLNIKQEYKNPKHTETTYYIQKQS